ncbi:nonsense-mediated mRNA decay protein 2-like [Papaver somniferum]|uniref:nonsense-mediated mRNA decay protein 2-like n=1 Tax=Papaver somniferum TaxID=3469 RepID=UPI000E6F5DD4|nr:nonsense-mediated mRNA decay protein 2-like [Papaver somniferum]
MRCGSLITRVKLKDPTKLGKLDVENEILRIMKLKPKLDREIERNVEDLYGKNRQENSTDALKENRIAQTRRDEVLEELSDLQVKHEKLVSFIEEKSKKLHAADLKIISFNKALKSEDERGDDKQEKEECEKGEKSGKGGDVDDSDDDDNDEKDKKGGKGGDLDDDDSNDDDEEGQKGVDLHDDSDDDEEEEEKGGKGGDLHDDDNDKEGRKGGDEEDRTES